MQEAKSYSPVMQDFSYSPPMGLRDTVREFIASEVERQDAALSDWSKAIGKNHAYLQQFISRGVPAELPEKVRKQLAKVIGVPESKLLPNGGHNEDGTEYEPEHVLEDHARPANGILEIDVRAGLGAGGTLDGREVRHDGDYADPVKPEAWKFPARFMREELRAPESRVIILETDGDSMYPTIGSGERVIVDTGLRIPSPDGIFALRDRFGNIVVKRLQVLRSGEPPRIKIISDNQHHAAEEVGADEIEIVGRVLWGLKRL